MDPANDPSQTWITGDIHYFSLRISPLSDRIWKRFVDKNDPGVFFSCRITGLKTEIVLAGA